MIYEIISKLLSESLLSLYPVFVKLINLPIGIQLWSRFFTYILISLFFVNIKFIYKYLFSYNAILLSLITMAHVYTSYRGFQLLESGVAYVIFYTYPLFILLLSGERINPIILLTLIGVYILATDKKENEKKDDESSEIKERFKYEGITMILLASLTEALIYFVVRRIKTPNNWNHLFISYFLGAVILTVYYRKNITNDEVGINLNNRVIISLILNIIIGLLGYLLRFYAISRLSPEIYAPLSYFGIIMAFFYRVLFSGYIITIKKIIGSLIVIFPLLINK